VYHKQPLTDSSVIMDVMNVEQAKIAEAAGAVAVMALGEFPVGRGGGGLCKDPQQSTAVPDLPCPMGLVIEIHRYHLR
jgi:pyridoxal biosynthesis lyase PdxS